MTALMTAFSKVTFKAQPRWASLRALERLLRPVLGSKALRVPVAQNGREKRENLKVVEVTQWDTQKLDSQ